MSRALTFFTGSKVATAATASALAVVTTATLVAGGMVAKDVVDFGRDHSVSVLPAIDEPLGPIVVKGTGPLDREVAVAGAPARSVAGTPASRRASSPFRTASLLDAPNEVTGSVSTAIDPEEPGRMDEESTLDRLESLIKPDDDQPDDPQVDDDSGAEDEGPPEDDGPDLFLTKTVEGTTAPVEEAVEQATDVDYSVTAAGSASPSA